MQVSFTWIYVRKQQEGEFYGDELSCLNWDYFNAKKYPPKG